MVYKGITDTATSFTDNKKTVSSMFFMLLQKRVIIYSDCATPTSEQLAAICSAETAKLFGIKPKIAMLCYVMLKYVMLKYVMLKEKVENDRE